jgi:hypothetical protein
MATIRHHVQYAPLNLVNTYKHTECTHNRIHSQTASLAPHCFRMVLIRMIQHNSIITSSCMPSVCAVLLLLVGHSKKLVSQDRLECFRTISLVRVCTRTGETRVIA